MKSRTLTLSATFAVAAALALSYATPAMAHRSGDKPGVQRSAPQVAHRSATKQGNMTKPATPKGTMCYSQRDNDNGVGIVSQNFQSDFDAYDSQGADDFTVTTPCTALEIIADGAYFNGSGPATSLHVVFYSDAGGQPGDVISDQDNLAYKDLGSGTFDAILDPVSLDPGKYWVSVQANMDFNAGGEWGWNTNNTKRGTGAVWQNPNGGFGSGCPTWGTLTTCVADGEGPDFSFSLPGTSSNKVTLRGLTKTGANTKAGNAACPGSSYYLYSGGNDDNYAAPADLSYPSPNLLAFMGASPGGNVNYDTPVNNGRFGDTFNLQNTRSVCYAVLQFRAKWSPTGDIPMNDGLTFGHITTPPTTFHVVGQVINAGVSAAGLNQSYALTPGAGGGLDLLSHLTGYADPTTRTPNDSTLDVYLQDDTELDYVRLYVWYGPNCTQAGAPNYGGCTK